MLSELRDAIDSHALAQAQAVKLKDDEGLIHEAEKMLGSIGRGERRIGVLKHALDCKDAVLLRACIAECGQEDLEGEVNLKMAKHRLEALDSESCHEGLWHRRHRRAG